MPESASGGAALRLGFAGLGRAAATHREALATVPAAELAAVQDVDPDALTRFPAPRRAARHATFAGLLESGVDAVLILTPPDRHAQMALAALSAGKHVFIEKPIATDAAAAAAILSAARRAGRILRVGHVTRYDAELVAMRDRIRSGGLGRVFRAHARAAVPFLPETGGWRAGPAAGGGVLMDIGIHALDALSFVLGDPPFEVLGARLGSAWGKASPEDHAAALLAAGDVTVTLAAAMGVPAAAGLSAATIEIQGTQGWMRNRPLAGWTVSGEPLSFDVPSDETSAKAFSRQLQSFVDACRDGKTGSDQVDRAVDMLRLVLDIYDRVKRGE